TTRGATELSGIDKSGGMTRLICVADMYSNSAAVPFTVTATPPMAVGSGAEALSVVLLRPFPVIVTRQPGDIAASNDAAFTTDAIVGCANAKAAMRCSRATNVNEFFMLLNVDRDFIARYKESTCQERREMH